MMNIKKNKILKQITIKFCKKLMSRKMLYNRSCIKMTKKNFMQKDIYRENRNKRYHNNYKNI